MVLEDIVDTGNTIEHILAVLADHQPAASASRRCSSSPMRYKKNIPIDGEALRIPNAFVVVGPRP